MTFWDRIKAEWEKEVEDVKEYTSEQIEAVTDYRYRKVQAAKSWWQKAKDWVSDHALKLFIVALAVAGIFFMVATHAAGLWTEFTRTERAIAESSVFRLFAIDGDGNATATCSAVLISPNTMLTAAHCKSAAEVVDDNGVHRKVTSWEILKGAPDTMVIRVEGMHCLPPHACVPVLSKAEVKMDERVRIVGYPYGVGMASYPARTIEWTTIVVRNGVTGPDGDVFLLVGSIMPVHGGQSGGGVFVVQDGIVYLIGVVTGGSNAANGEGAHVAVSVLK